MSCPETRPPRATPSPSSRARIPAFVRSPWAAPSPDALLSCTHTLTIVRPPALPAPSSSPVPLPSRWPLSHCPVLPLPLASSSPSLPLSHCLQVAAGTVVGAGTDDDQLSPPKHAYGSNDGSDADSETCADLSRHRRPGNDGTLRLTSKYLRTSARTLSSGHIQPHPLHSRSPLSHQIKSHPQVTFSNAVLQHFIYVY